MSIFLGSDILITSVGREQSLHITKIGGKKKSSKTYLLTVKDLQNNGHIYKILAHSKQETTHMYYPITKISHCR